MHFFIHNSFHAGDIVLSRALIMRVRQQFPGVKITLECPENRKYLWEDLQLPISIFPGHEYTSTKPTPNCPLDAVFINIWFGLYQDINEEYSLTHFNQIHTFNRQIYENNLQHKYLLKSVMYPSAVDFFQDVKLPFEVMPRGILVENGVVLSGQSYVDLNVQLHLITTNFPDLTFYCAAKPLFSAPNVIDCCDLNLIELAELSNRCCAFITRGSGVNATSYTEINRFKPRCIFGIITQEIIIWSDSRNPVVYADSVPDVIMFLSSVADKFLIREKLVKPEFVKMCKFLKSRTEVAECTEYLYKNGYFSHELLCKDWDIAHIIADLSDGNLLDMGSSDSHILKNAVKKQVRGEKIGIDLRQSNVPVEGVKYIVGDLMKVPLADNYFQNITCLSVIEHEVDYLKFAAEVSRLLQKNGKLYVTFDYWTPKIHTNMKLYNLEWNILDDAEVNCLVEACDKHGLLLSEEIDWTLGQPIITQGYYSPHPNIHYTFGMLVFQKKT